jgi:hypothetical protein
LLTAAVSSIDESPPNGPRRMGCSTPRMLMLATLLSDAEPGPGAATTPG